METVSVSNEGQSREIKGLLEKGRSLFRLLEPVSLHSLRKAAFLFLYRSSMLNSLSHTLLLPFQGTATEALQQALLWTPQQAAPHVLFLSGFMEMRVRVFQSE